MRRLLLSIIVTALPFAADAQDSALPPMGTIERMFSDAQKARFICSLSMHLQLLTRELATKGQAVADENANKGETCIAQHKIELAQSYKAAIAKLAKKPEALKSAKQYHVFALTMLDGMRPLGGELKIQYTTRQNANEAKLKELENLVRVDAQ